MTISSGKEEDFSDGINSSFEIGLQKHAGAQVKKAVTGGETMETGAEDTKPCVRRRDPLPGDFFATGNIKRRANKGHGEKKRGVRANASRLQ